MSITAAKGFRAAGVEAGLKSNGGLDVALVVNDGPKSAIAGVFTSNRVQAAPVKWTKNIVKKQKVKTIVLNSGGANACTGSVGDDDVARTASATARSLGMSASEIAVCSTGLIGEYLPMANVIDGITKASLELKAEEHSAAQAARAIMTTDSVPKTSVYRGDGFTIGGMAKGAGMLAPALATMLVVLTTDADVSSPQLQEALECATAITFDRIDSDGCMSTNDTVLLMASGASKVEPSVGEFDVALEAVCMDLARQLIADAEGASKDITVHVCGASSTDDAVEVAKAVSRSNLLKCAIHGEDPNWGRVLSAVGTTKAVFDPDKVGIAINDIWVCRDGSIGEDRSKVDMSDRNVRIVIDLTSGTEMATVITNDLTAAYVHENSSYSS